MEDLITTVRERYGHAVGFRGLSTLVHRETRAVRGFGSGDTDEDRNRGLLGFLRPQLQSVSKQIHDEIVKLFERRDKLLLQTVNRDMPKIIGTNTAQLRSDSQKFIKTQADKTARLEKRVELIGSDTGVKMKNIQNELQRLKAGEKNRAREQARTERERLQKADVLRRTENRETLRAREELRREIGADIQRVERRIIQKQRDDEEYEKRRRG